MVSWQERIGVGQQNHSGHSVLHLQQGLGFNKSPQCGRRAHLAPRKRSVKPLLKQSAWRLSRYSALRLLAIHSRTWCSLRATKELQRSWSYTEPSQSLQIVIFPYTYIYICFQLFPYISIYVLICSFFCSCVYRLCLRCCVAELRTKMVHQKRRRNPLQCEGLPLWPRITLAMDSSIAPTYGNLRFPHSIWTLTVHSLYIPKTFPKGSKREPKIWAVWVHKKTRTACTSVSRFRSKPKLQTTKVPPWMNSNKRAIWSWCCSDVADDSSPAHHKNGLQTALRCSISQEIAREICLCIRLCLSKGFLNGTENAVWNHPISIHQSRGQYIVTTVFSSLVGQPQG